MAIIPIKYLSHGTVPCYDINYTTDLLVNLFGFEYTRTSKNSASFRINKEYCFSVLELYKEPINDIDSRMANHHVGLDLPTKEDVDKAHEDVQQYIKRFKLRKITTPKYGHGTYYFYIVDNDSNYWEVLMNPHGGYDYRFHEPLDLRLFKEQDERQGVSKQEAYKDFEHEIS
jgi:hypothetical protein